MQSTRFSLLMRLRESESGDAWERFTQLYTPLLFFWARRVGLNSADADDFVQDVLVLLIDRIGNFEHRGQGSFRAWLRTVAINKCRQRFRRRSPVAVGCDDPVMESLAAVETDPFWEVEYRQHLVARALEIMRSQFEPATWQACWQRTVEGRPAAEVAKNLGLSEGAVYVYTGRVLRRLREELAELL
jgi:RNA polymerase sigma-70 factor (ECF subfamily)